MYKEIALISSKFAREMHGDIKTRFAFFLVVDVIRVLVCLGNHGQQIYHLPMDVLIIMELSSTNFFMLLVSFMK